MHHWLKELGQAHQAGAFQSGSRYPWQTAQPVATARTPRRVAWVRVAGPLAAAAVVGFVFVWPSSFTTSSRLHLADRTPATVAPQDVSNPVMATSTRANVIDCDFNGDGVVNGEDI